MARLTRKFLTALKIEDENIQDQIINAHTEATDALKAQRDEYKQAFDELPKVKSDLEKANADLESFKASENPYKTKYEEKEKELNDLKTDIENKRILGIKKSEYKKLLKDIKISEDAIDSIIEVTKFDDIELDGEKIKNAETLKENAKTKWKSFVVTTTTRGAGTETPPANNGKGITKEEILAIKDTAARQKAMAEHSDLFGI